MSIMHLAALAASGANRPSQSIDDVFLCDQYQGTGAALTITDGIDRTDGVPVLDIFRCITSAQAAQWYDTVRGATQVLKSNVTDNSTTLSTGLTAYAANGFSLGSSVTVNSNTAVYARYTFKEADKFFMIRQIAHVSGTADIVDLSKLGTVGMVIMKRVDSSSDFLLWHRSMSANQLQVLNSTAAPVTNFNYSVSGTTLTTLSTLTTGTYIIYAWAHDSGVDGLIQCGVSAGVSATQVNLGWEPQMAWHFSLNTVSNRIIVDEKVGMGLLSSESYQTQLNGTSVQAVQSTCLKDSTLMGLRFAALTTSHAYMSIRGNDRKTPNSGTDVFAAAVQMGAGIVTAGFTPDAIMELNRNALNSATTTLLRSAMRGRSYGQALSTAVSEVSAAATDRLSAAGFFNAIGSSAQFMRYWALRRGRGCYEQMLYSGTSTTRTQAHNLGVTPEWLMVAPLDTLSVDGSGASARAFAVRNTAALSNNETVFTHQTSAKTNIYDTWGGGGIGNSTTFNLGGGDPATNLSGVVYIAHMFATLSGVSKVGSYTGNGTSQTINCGFSTGARAILIKRVDATGNWWFWDSVSGIAAGSERSASWNDTAEIVNDAIDPDPSGFIVEEEANNHINVSGGTYMFLAIA